MSFREDIRGRVSGSRRKAQTYEYLTVFLYGVVVLSSAAAAFSVAGNLLPKSTTAVLAAIPGAVSLSLGKFNSFSRWWWKKWLYLDALHRDLSVGADEEVINEKMSEFLFKHNDEYPGWGTPPT